VKKEYRIEYENKYSGEVHHGYRLISAENEHAARAKFSKEHHNIQYKILAVDELDPDSITMQIEGAHLSTIPALQRLPLTSLVITAITPSSCEWGGEQKVWRDAEGHRLANISTGACCFGYALDPAVKPYFFVESADGKLGVQLCQEHLEENFPHWREIVRPRRYAQKPSGTNGANN
jgi:hypothetical protein